MNQPQNPSDFDYHDEPLPEDALDNDADFYMDDEDLLGEPAKQQEAASQDAPQAKKSKMISLLIIGTGAVIGLGVIYTMLSSGQQQQAIPTDMTATPMPEAIMPTTPTAITDPTLIQQPDALPMPPTPDMAGMTPPDTLATLPPAPATAPVTAPADPDQILATELPPLATTPVIEPALTTEIAATDLPKTENNTALPTTTPTAPTPAIDGEALAALTKSLEKIDERLQALEGRLDTQSDTQSQLAEDINALKSSVAKKAVTENKKPLIEEVTTTEAPAPKKASAPKKKKPLAAEDKAYVPPAIQKQPTAATATVSNWQLRGAAQGKAWVAKTGSTELLVVTVGDTLPGLGVISSITNSSGKWVVQGQNGRITD